ncbi:hypothetical protein C8R43DRAFT_1130874 [Mycena crocata]|nr:hypothetical protein C8R43DRAFT_1130874 [Mycena crocata]
MLVVAAAPALVTVLAPFGTADSEPLTGAILGVDSKGRTTYALDQNEMIGSSTAALITGTLVEGSDYFSYMFSHTSASNTFIFGPLDCAIQGNDAVCTAVDSDSQPITTTLASLAPLVIDVTSTAAPGGSAPTSQPTPPPSGSAPGPEASDKPSSSQRISASVLGVFMSVALAYQLV